MVATERLDHVTRQFTELSQANAQFRFRPCAGTVIRRLLDAERNLWGRDGNNPAGDVVRNRGDARKLRTRTAVAVRETAAVDYFSPWTCSVCKPEAMSSTIPIMSRVTTPAIVSAQNHEDVALSSAA